MPRYPSVGDVLRHRLQSGRTIEARVVETDPARRVVKVRIEERIYSSLSAAAKDTAGYEANGWIYWGLKKQTRRPRHTPPVEPS